MAPSDLEQDPQLQQAGWWEWLGLVLALVVSSGGWLAVAYGMLWSSPRIAKVGVFMLLVTGSALMFYGLVRSELDERAHLRRRRDHRRAA